MDPVRIVFQAEGVERVSAAFRSVSDALAKIEKANTATTARAARTRVSGAQKEARDRVKAEERGGQDAAKAYAKTEIAKTKAAKVAARDRQQIAKATVDAEIKEWERGRKAQQKLRDKIAGGAARGIGRGLSGMASAASAMAGGAMQIGGGFSIADTVQRAMSAKGRAADIANSGFMPNGANAANRTKKSSGDILGAARATAMSNGMDEDDVLGGLQTFTGKTGDLDTGLKMMGRLAELATATGSSFEDMASAAAEAFNSDTTQSADDLMVTMRTLAGQGKLGAVEIRDLARQAAKLTASAGQFSGNKSDNIATLGAMAQQAKAGGGATSAAEAATSVSNFASDVAKGASSGKFKFNVKDGKVLKGPEEIILGALKQTGGDVSQLSNIFGKRSVRSVLKSAEVYRNAGGGEKGEAAVKDLFESFRKSAMTEAEVKSAAAARMEEDDKKIAVAMEELRVAVANDVVPAVRELLPHLHEFVPVVSDLVKRGVQLGQWLAENPMKGLGVILAGYMAKEIVGCLAGGSLMVPTAMLAIGTAAIELGAKADADQDRNVVAQEVDATNAVGNVNANVRAGTVSAADVTTLKDARGGLQAALDKERQGPSTFQKVGSFIASDKIFGDGGESERRDDATRKRHIAELTAQIAEVNSRLSSLGAALAQATPSASNPNAPGRNLPQTHAARGGAAQ